MAGVELRIESIGVDVPVVGIAPNGDGWDLTWLGPSAGWLEGTSFPGWQGNSALTGHVTLPSGEPGPFSRLDELAWGDRVVVEAFGQRPIYEVRQVLSVLPQVPYPLRHEDRAWLTLITCLEFDERLDTYRGRLGVRAILIDVEDIPAGVRSPSLLIRAAGSRSAAY